MLFGGIENILIRIDDECSVVLLIEVRRSSFLEEIVIVKISSIVVKHFVVEVFNGGLLAVRKGWQARLGRFIRRSQPPNPVSIPLAQPPAASRFSYADHLRCGLDTVPSVEITNENQSLLHRRIEFFVNLLFKFCL